MKEVTIMKTTSVGAILAVLIGCTSLTASITITAKNEQAQTRIRAGQLKRITVDNEGIQLYNVAPRVSLDWGPSDERRGTDVLQGQQALLRDYSDRNDDPIKAPTLAALGHPAVPSNDSTNVALDSVADASVWVMKTLQATATKNASRLTFLEGMPARIWCKVFSCKRGW
jgi:hypothetical protein